MGRVLTGIGGRAGVPFSAVGVAAATFVDGIGGVVSCCRLPIPMTTSSIVVNERESVWERVGSPRGAEWKWRQRSTASDCALRLAVALGGSTRVGWILHRVEQGAPCVLCSRDAVAAAAAAAASSPPGPGQAGAERYRVKLGCRRVSSQLVSVRRSGSWELAGERPASRVRHTRGPVRGARAHDHLSKTPCAASAFATAGRYGCGRWWSVRAFIFCVRATRCQLPHRSAGTARGTSVRGHKERGG